MKRIVLLGRSVQHAGQSRKVTILLADDHPHFLQLIERLLKAKFDVLGRVADGESLVEAARRLHPEVILTDISMPALSGIEAVERLKKEGSQAKFIFVTVHTGADFVKACLDLGAVGYVLKPRVATELLPAIQEALVGHTYVSREACQEGVA